jgi:hypothetical protein
MAETGRPQWWLIGVAAVLAAFFLYQSIGLAASVGLCLAALVGPPIYRFLRARNPAKGPTVRCLICGEALPNTARQCKHCGGASWTVKN